MVAPPRINAPTVAFYPFWLPEVVNAGCLKPEANWSAGNAAWMRLPGPIIGHIQADDDSVPTLPVVQPVIPPTVDEEMEDAGIAEEAEGQGQDPPSAAVVELNQRAGDEEVVEVD